jgi:dihydroflavonol-4-reductase
MMAAMISGTRATQLVIPLRLAELALPLMEKLATIRGSQPLFTHAMLSALKSYRNVSHANATRDLGYAPRPFLETLTDTLNWFQAQRNSS